MFVHYFQKLKTMTYKPRKTLNFCILQDFHMKNLISMINQNLKMI
jgi:hypothetical protein